ncbi:MAG: hypothetical protein ACFFCW_11750 [Candidatus Hodarchaeota archaeon]
MNTEEFTKPNREGQNKNRAIDKNELIALFEQYREQELVMVKLCHEKEENFKSTGVKLLLSLIQMNSTKLVHILQILIDILKEGPSEYLWDNLIDLYV